MTDDEIKKLADRLYDEQERLNPYLTIRHCAETLRLNSDGTQRALRRMVQLGFAQAITFGESGAKNRYRFLKPNE